MRDLEVSDPADRDLRGIAARSREDWGAQRTASYMSDLAARMRRLRRDPFLGRLQEDVDPPMRAVTCGRHVIFYEVEPERVLVLRVLHDRMDHPAHLNPRS